MLSFVDLPQISQELQSEFGFEFFHSQSLVSHLDLIESSSFVVHCFILVVFFFNELVKGGCLSRNNVFLSNCNFVDIVLLVALFKRDQVHESVEIFCVIFLGDVESLTVSSERCQFV